MFKRTARPTGIILFLIILLSVFAGTAAAAHDTEDTDHDALVNSEMDPTLDRQTTLGSDVSSVATSHGPAVTEAVRSGEVNEVRTVATKNGDKVMRILKKKLPG